MAKLSYIHISVSDLDRSIDFYSNKMGLETTKYMKSAAAVGLEPGSLDLDQLPLSKIADFATRNDDRHIIVAIKVPDLVAYYDQLKTRGVQTEDASTKRPWGSFNFYLKDPDGYTIEIEEEKPDIQKEDERTG